MSQDGVEETGGEDGPGTEQTEDKDDEEKLEREKTLLNLKKQKRIRKTEMTKIRHHMEKLCITPKDVDAIEKDIEQLWSLVEITLEILDELCVVYLKNGEEANKQAAMEEGQMLESEIQTAIEKAHEAVKSHVQISVATASHSEFVAHPSLPIVLQGSLNPASPPPPSQSAHSSQGEAGVPESPPASHSANHRLKPLKVPSYGGDKTKFEEFWGLFESLVDQSKEPVNLKMARLRQCLYGSALEAIRGLGVSEPEYEEAKEILIAKFGGQRRQLRAYMDQLERMPQMRNNDVQGFERFADLVRITVVKLKAEGRDGELGEGTLHSLLVRKLAEVQVQGYSRWLQEQSRERSVVSLKDWLKEEVRIRVEATEMAHGLSVTEKSDGWQHSNRNPNNQNKSRNFHVKSDFTRRPPGSGQPYRKPPCPCCGSRIMEYGPA